MFKNTRWLAPLDNRDFHTTSEVLDSTPVEAPASTVEMTEVANARVNSISVYPGFDSM